MTVPIRTIHAFPERIFVILNFGNKEKAIPRICEVVAEIIKDEIARERKLARRRRKKPKQ